MPVCGIVESTPGEFNQVDLIADLRGIHELRYRQITSRTY